MPNKRNSHPTRLTPDIRAGQRLAALAREAAQPSDPGSARPRLKAEIEALLAARKDGALEAAHSMIDDPAALGELESCIDEASQVAELFVGWDGACPQPSEAMLFAIPVILGLLPGEDVPESIPNLDPLIESLRRHGLVDSRPGVYLAPELLRLPDADMPPSRRRLILQSLVTRYFGGDLGALPSDPSPGTAEWEILESGFPGLALGFLVGAVISSLDAGARPFYPDDAEADEYDDRCESWADEMSAWLERQTGHAFALALPPEILSDSIRTGVDEYRATALEIVAKTAALASAGGPAQCRAEVAPTGTGGSRPGVRIGISDGGGSMNGYTWPLWPFDDGAATVGLIVDILEAEGIGRVEALRDGER